MIGKKHDILLYLSTVSYDVLLELTEVRDTRSIAQLRLYRQWLTDLCWCFSEKGIFITPEELHEWLKAKLIPGNYKRNPLGVRVHEQKTTTKLNKKEFSKYIEDIIKYLWREYEISYPLPTDFFYEKKEKYTTTHISQ